MGITWSEHKKTNDSIICIADGDCLNQNAWYVYKRMKKNLTADGFSIKKDTKTNGWFIIYSGKYESDSYNPVNYKDHTGNVVRMDKWQAQRDEKLQKFIVLTKKLDVMFPEEVKVDQVVETQELMEQMRKTKNTTKTHNGDDLADAF